MTPRLIARLEIAYHDGARDVIVSDRSLADRARRAGHRRLVLRRRLRRPPRTAGLGRARRRTCRPRRSAATASATGWIDAGIAPPPNLATRLVARAAEPVKVAGAVHAGVGDQPGAGHLGVRLRAEHRRLARAAPAAGCRPARPCGCRRPSRSTADGTVDQARSWAAAAAAAGTCSTPTPPPAPPGGETWHPDFNYFGMQWVQVTGLPEGYVPTTET